MWGRQRFLDSYDIRFGTLAAYDAALSVDALNVKERIIKIKEKAPARKGFRHTILPEGREIRLRIWPNPDPSLPAWGGGAKL